MPAPTVDPVRLMVKQVLAAQQAQAAQITAIAQQIAALNTAIASLPKSTVTAQDVVDLKGLIQKTIDQLTQETPVSI